MLSMANCLKRAARCWRKRSRSQTLPTGCCGWCCDTCGCRHGVCASSLALRDCFAISGLARLLLKLRLARLISPRAEFALALLESSRPVIRGRQSSARSERGGENVLLFTGCVGEGLFARVNRATERVLRANNLNVTRHRTRFVAARCMRMPAISKAHGSLRERTSPLSTPMPQSLRMRVAVARC